MKDRLQYVLLVTQGEWRILKKTALKEQQSREERKEFYFSIFLSGKVWKSIPENFKNL